jgi:hypothetical protein
MAHQKVTLTPIEIVEKTKVRITRSGFGKAFQRFLKDTGNFFVTTLGLPK